MAEDGSRVRRPVLQLTYSVTTNNQSTPWRPARIMVATDLSLISGKALNYAAGLARHFDSLIYLTHVLTNPDDSAGLGGGADANQERREDAGRKSSEILKSGQMDGVRNTVLLEEGFLFETLEALGRKYEIDLVVIGTHGRKVVKKEFLGSWAELIFRHADCPVMTVGPACAEESSGEVKFTKILLATDFGRASGRATPYACSLAREYGAELTLLNVIKVTSNYSEREWAVLKETTRIRLIESLPPEMEQKCAPEYVVRCGDSALEILNVARSKKVDLIVMGARLGKNLVAHLPEPIAYTVAAEAPCPVLTVGAY